MAFCLHLALQRDLPFFEVKTDISSLDTDKGSFYEWLGFLRGMDINDMLAFLDIGRMLVHPKDSKVFCLNGILDGFTWDKKLVEFIIPEIRVEATKIP